MIICIIDYFLSRCDISACFAQTNQIISNL